MATWVNSTPDRQHCNGQLDIVQVVRYGIKRKTLRMKSHSPTVCGNFVLMLTRYLKDKDDQKYDHNALIHPEI